MDSGWTTARISDTSSIGCCAATGGAALTIGRLVARDGRRGEFKLIQGRAGDACLGYFKLSLDDGWIRLGGRVVELIDGRLLVCEHHRHARAVVGRPASSSRQLPGRRRQQAPEMQVIHVGPELQFFTATVEKVAAEPKAS